VAGRYQPLADDVTIAGDIRPNLSSAVHSEDKGNRTSGKFDFLRLRRRYGASIGIGGDRRQASCVYQPEIVGLCPRFPADQLATAIQRSDFSMGSRR
jgi:hypothetical protein